MSRRIEFGELVSGEILPRRMCLLVLLAVSSKAATFATAAFTQDVRCCINVATDVVVQELVRHSLPREIRIQRQGNTNGAIIGYEGVVLNRVLEILVDETCACGKVLHLGAEEGNEASIANDN